MAAERTPIVETQTVSETRKTFSETLDRVYRGEARVIVERSGIPVGAIVSEDDLSELQRMEARREAQWAAIDRMREAFADTSDEEFNAELEKAIREVEEMRTRRLDPMVAGS